MTNDPINPPPKDFCVEVADDIFDRMKSTIHWGDGWTDLYNYILKRVTEVSQHDK